ncbi:MAG: glycosyl transferase [Xanthobacteraceae bacterium]|nr:glycosyl transferase [Xanthobacteraceae bacterium]
MTALAPTTAWPLFTMVVPAAAAALCAAAIILLHPLLVRYALARPNARSSHTTPTPQGAGIAVMAATIILVAVEGFVTRSVATSPAVTVVLCAAVGLAATGAIDDLRPLGVLPRLVLQLVAVAAAVAVLPDGLRVVAPLPVWLERMLELVALVWFVNLVNFMDGLDWMTVAEMLPVTVALAAFGLAGAAPAAVVPVTLALAGALVGFAPFNRPVARLFLGDVGSLPLGLVVGWCLVLLAGAGHLVAALLLPLYYLADATLTLLARLRRGERVWEAHRSHFYQRATDNGYRVIEVVAGVFVLNLVLATLAAASIWLVAAPWNVLLLAFGGLAVTIVLRSFATMRA